LLITSAGSRPAELFVFLRNVEAPPEGLSPCLCALTLSCCLDAFFCFCAANFSDLWRLTANPLIVVQFAYLGMRAKRAISCLAKNARPSHGAPRSLARQKRATRDDKCKLHHYRILWFDRQRCLCRISLAVLSWKAARNRRIRVTCRSGGIGRRAWFRSMCPQGRGGSSPFFGTNS